MEPIKTTAVDKYNKLREMYGGPQAYEFAMTMAEIHAKFAEDDIPGKILCAVVAPVDGNLQYTFLCVPPTVYSKDKYAILRDNGIRDGEVFLPLEFKHLLH